jgi:hypothetical protein
MDTQTRKQIVAALLRSGRRDLAQLVSAKTKPVDLLHLEEALTKTVFDMAKKKKWKLHSRAKQQFSYLVKKWVDAVETMID